jgi:GNAT superfamily N-acetyltransferase
MTCADETSMTRLRVSTDPAELDVALIHRFLSEQSSWARGIPLATVETSLRHSLCFGGFLKDAQIAFARVISDRATFANRVDVFVLPEYRGHGHAQELMRAVMAHPDLQGIRRFTLNTVDAHGLYAQFGFAPPRKPETAMERYSPGMYENTAGGESVDPMQR